MARTRLTSRDIKDGQVKREDLNILELGQAVIRRIIAGSGITITSTGADSGTGDVTIEATVTGVGVSGSTNLDGGRSDSLYLIDMCSDGGNASGN